MSAQVSPLDRGKGNTNISSSLTHKSSQTLRVTPMKSQAVSFDRIRWNFNTTPLNFDPECRHCSSKMCTIVPIFLALAEKPNSQTVSHRPISSIDLSRREMILAGRRSFWRNEGNSSRTEKASSRRESRPAERGCQEAQKISTDREKSACLSLHSLSGSSQPPHLNQPLSRVGQLRRATGMYHKGASIKDHTAREGLAWKAY